MFFQVHPKERFYLVLMVGFSAVVYLSVLFFNPLIIFLIPVFLFIQWITSYLFLGYIRGNAIRITEHQFPAIDAIVKEYAALLDMAVPQVYVLQGNGILNAFAVKLSRKKFIVLHSEIMQLIYKNKVDAVSFIIGHELGHLKRGHVSHVLHALTLPARLIPLLGKAYSRACEYTCDRIGFSLCSEGATDGIALLAVGENLLNQVNLKVLETKSFSITFAELFSTHPCLIRRLKELSNMQQDLAQKKEITSPINVLPEVQQSDQINV